MRAFAALGLAALLAVVPGSFQSAFAQKAQFQRSKPHVNVSTSRSGKIKRTTADGRGYVAGRFAFVLDGSKNSAPPPRHQGFLLGPGDPDANKEPAQTVFPNVTFTTSQTDAQPVEPDNIKRKNLTTISYGSASEGSFRPNRRRR